MSRNISITRRELDYIKNQRAIRVTEQLIDAANQDDKRISEIIEKQKELEARILALESI